MPETPIDCLAYADDLSALIDRELDVVREAEVRAHADACEHCAQRLQELCNVDRVLAGLPTPVVADDLQTRFQARLAAAGPAATPSRSSRSAPPRRRRRGAALGIAGGLAVAAAVMLALLFGLPRDVSEPGVPIAREDAAPPAERRDVPEPEPRVIADVPEPAAAVVAETPPAESAPELVAEQSLPEPAVIQPAPAPAAQLGALDALPDEDVALLLELDAVADLDLMDNLDLLEALVDLGVADGA